MKKLAKKMTLTRETVRQLSPGDASWIAGGAVAKTGQTDQPFCVSDALSCTQWCNGGVQGDL